MTLTGTAHRTRPAGRQWLALAGFVAAVTVAAGIGALGVTGTTGEYAALDKPGWAPPAAVFGPVWTVLYAMVAVAGWLLWRRAGRTPALSAYAVQLVLNAAWTPLFFGAGRYGLAAVESVLLWLAVGVTVLLALRVSRPAALLLVPYWAWVSYATALNVAVWWLN